MFCGEYCWGEDNLLWRGLPPFGDLQVTIQVWRELVFVCYNSLHYHLPSRNLPDVGVIVRRSDTFVFLHYWCFIALLFVVNIPDVARDAHGLVPFVFNMLYFAHMFSV